MRSLDKPTSSRQSKILHEALAGAVPQLRFGIAFCEPSGPRLVRRSGNDPKLIELAIRNALAIGAEHSFIVFLRDSISVNVLNQVKLVPEVCRIYCATANPKQVIVGETTTGGGILGVVDGGSAGRPTGRCRCAPTAAPRRSGRKTLTSGRSAA